MKKVLLGITISIISIASFADTNSAFYEFSLTSVQNQGLSGCGGNPNVELDISICGFYPNDGKKHRWNSSKCYKIGDTLGTPAPNNGETISTDLSVKLSENKLGKLERKLLKEGRNDIFISASLNKTESLFCGFFTNDGVRLRLSSRKSTIIELENLKAIASGESKDYIINFHGDYDYGVNPATDEMRPFSVIGNIKASLFQE